MRQYVRQSKTPREIRGVVGELTVLDRAMDRCPQLHVLKRRLDALAPFRRSGLLASDTGRLEVLSPSGFGNNRLLLHALREAPEEPLKTLAVVDSNFYQQFS